jgi:DNA polymerase III delta subunit
VITLLTGENSFELQRALDRISAGFNGQPERLDGAEVAVGQLPELLMGGTLFADKRLVIIKSLSENKSVWDQLADWCEKVSDDIHLALVDPKPDKRTRTYKQLQKFAHIEEYRVWGERDIQKAESWVAEEARRQGWELNKKSAQALVARLGVDQWALVGALDKLAVVDEVSPAVIEQIIEAQPSENVFNLFEAALSGERSDVQKMIRTLELNEDPYMVFGLLSGQAFHLAVLAVGDKPPGDSAKDVGAHPFALSKLAPYARKLGKQGAKKIVAIFADADDAMKTSAAEPWLLIERALIKVANI